MEDYKIVKLRCIAILVVVLGHSIILYDPLWGIYHTKFSINWLMNMKHFINTFQMPLFMSISGYCFFISVKKHKYNSYNSIKKGVYAKFKRLIIPFVMTSLFWMIPIRKLCRYPSWVHMKLLTILFNVFLGYDSGHLWFLPTLFMIFLFSFIILPSSNYFSDIIILVLSFFLSIISLKLPSIIFFSYACSNYFWFVFGYLINKYKKTVLFKINLVDIKTIFCLILLIFFTVCNYDFIIFKILEKLVVSVFIFLLYGCFSEKKCTKITEFISNNSMGLYLLHSPLIYFTFYFYHDSNPIFVIFLNFIVFGVFSLILTNIIRKTKIKFMLGY